MRTRPEAGISRFVRLALAFALVLVGLTACDLLRAPSGSLPNQLSDEEFWRLLTDLSEPPGVFTHSDNLVSNETFYVHTVRQLRARGGVYIGVGPEQNFSFIARLEPAMAFVIDIRQQNRNLHLMYKALFEASADRTEFASRLFSRDLSMLGTNSSVDDLFTALATAPPSSALRTATGQLIRDRLVSTHHWALTPEDLASIDDALDAFSTDGPGIHYSRGRSDSQPRPSYRALMTARDVSGLPRSFLATDETFAVVKDLQSRNLIVPIVGDFGGPVAIARVGDYVRQKGSRISAFYGSNVEVYLTNQQMAAYCTSLASLPALTGAWYVGGRGAVTLATKLRTCPRVAESIEWRPPK